MNNCPLMIMNQILNRKTKIQINKQIKNNEKLNGFKCHIPSVDGTETRRTDEWDRIEKAVKNQLNTNE